MTPAQGGVRKRPALPREGRAGLCQLRGTGHRAGSAASLPDVDGDLPVKEKFKVYPIGFFHIDIAEVQTAEARLYLFVAIDRTSKFAIAALCGSFDRDFHRRRLARRQGQIRFCPGRHAVDDDLIGAGGQFHSRPIDSAASHH